MTVSAERTTGPRAHLTDASQTAASGTTLVPSATRGATSATSTTHAVQITTTSAARAMMTAMSGPTGATSLVESMPLAKLPSMTARWAGKVSLKPRRPVRARSPSTRPSNLSPAHHRRGTPVSSASERMPETAAGPPVSLAHGQAPAAKMTGTETRAVPRHRGTSATAIVAMSTVAMSGTASPNDRPRRSGGSRMQPAIAGAAGMTAGATIVVATPLQEPSAKLSRHSLPT